MMPSGEIMIMAPSELTPADRAELEALLAKAMPNNPPKVSYPISLEEIRAVTPRPGELDLPR
jgi:hypothetical protein